MPRDIFTEPAARDELSVLGLKEVPVAARDGRAIEIMHVDQLREFLGLPPEDAAASYQELVEALGRVLEAVERAVRQVPDAHLSTPTPNRGRDIRELAYNIHLPVRLMSEGLDSGLFDWSTSGDFAASRAFEATTQLADFCGDIRQAWLANARSATAEDVERVAWTPRGLITQQQVLESQAWHAAQHLRQIYVFLREIGVEPDHELTAEEMEPIHLGDTVF